MANLIDSTYFFGKLLIAQSTEPSVALSITKLIDGYEPEFLTKLFGYAMYKAYLAEVGTSGSRMEKLRDGEEFTNRYGVLDKWRGLKFADGSGKRSMIANYIYYWYSRNNATATTGTGEKTIGSKNAVNMDAARKQSTVWNEMVCWVKQFWEYIYSKQDVFPEYFDNWVVIKRESIELYKPINPFGL